MRVPGVPWQPCRYGHGTIVPTAIVLHRTYGTLNGDGFASATSVAQTGRGQGIGFHFLVGKRDGQWAQFYDTTTLCWHANNANGWAVGIEFDGVNEGPLTAWQVRAGAWIIGAVCDAHRIPRTYTSTGPRRRVAGCLPHLLAPGGTHTDMVTQADWGRIVSAWDVGPPAPPPPSAPAPGTSPALPVQEDDMILRDTESGAIWAVSATHMHHLSPPEWDKRAAVEKVTPFPVPPLYLLALAAGGRQVI